MRQRYKEKRPRRLGAMSTHRTRETQPSYARLLLRFGFITKHSTLQDAWGIWQRVCDDKEVIKLSGKLEKVFLPSVAAAYTHGVHVLTAMNENKLDALAERIGVKRKEKRSE